MPSKQEPIKRRIVTFEPSGPVCSMIDNELRGKSRGFRTQLMERAVVSYLRAKYPKLAQRWDVIASEKGFAA